MSVSRKKILLLWLAAILLAAILLTAGMGCNEAGVAASYGGKDTSELWYYKDDALAVDAAKQVVGGWRLDGVQPVVIAVVDTGIDVDHPLFDGVLLKSGDQVLGYNSYIDVDAGKTDISDTSGDKHGNGVAGIIAMLIKEFGLQDYIKIYPIKANTTGRSSFAIGAVSRAINRAAEIQADVINLSLGLLGSDMTRTDWANDSQLRYAIGNAAKVSVIVAAAGNNSQPSLSDDDKFYPAAMDGVLGIMNYTEGQTLYRSSNYGDAYDFAAPGKDVYTAGDGGYSYMTGTSAASPIASFATALLKLRLKAEGDNEQDGYALARMMRNLALRQVSYNNNQIKYLDLNTIVTQDFKNTAYDDEPVSGLEITHDGALGSEEYSDAVFMYANKVKPVSFVARILPYGYTDPEWQDALEWVLVDSNGGERRLGEGASLTYSPEVFGETQLQLRLNADGHYFEADQRIFIKYLPFLIGDCKVTYLSHANDSARVAPTEGVLYTTETTSFTLTGLRYIEPKPVKWYVNGRYVATGPSFDFTPTKTGTYVISASYDNSNPVQFGGFAFTAHVRSFVLRPLDLAMLVIGLTIALSAIAAVVVIILKKRANAAQAAPPADQE